MQAIRNFIFTRRSYWAPALFFTAAAVITFIYYFPLPQYDYWDIVRFYKEAKEGEYGFKDLFAIHGGHWHATGYVVSLALASLTQMNHSAEVFVILLLLALGFAGLAKIIRRACLAFDTPFLIPWTLGVAAFFYFSLDQVENFFSVWQIAVFANAAAALWCIELLGRGDITIKRTLTAGLCAAIAIYGFGGGWVLLPIGFALMLVNDALKTRAGRISIAIWAVLLVWFVAHFILGMRAGGAEQAPSQIATISFSLILPLTEYVVNYVMTPVTRFSAELTWPLTVASLLIFTLSCRQLIRAEPKSSGTLRAIAPLLAIGLYAIGSAILSALGRLDDFGPSQARIFRYITQGNYFWLMMALLPMLAAARSKGRLRYALFGFAGLTCAMKAGNIGNVMPQTLEGAVALRELTRDLQACPYDPLTPEARALLGEPEQPIETLMTFLYDNNLSLYRHQNTADLANAGDCARLDKG